MNPPQDPTCLHQIFWTIVIALSFYSNNLHSIQKTFICFDFLSNCVLTEQQAQTVFATNGVYTFCWEGWIGPPQTVHLQWTYTQSTQPYQNTKQDRIVRYILKQFTMQSCIYVFGWPMQKNRNQSWVTNHLLFLSGETFVFRDLKVEISEDQFCHSGAIFMYCFLQYNTNISTCWHHLVAR